MIGLIFPFISSRKVTIPIVKILYAVSLLMCILAIFYNGLLGFNYMTHERIFIASFVYSIPKLKKKKRLSYFGFLVFGAVILLDPRTTSLIAFVITIALTLLLERTASQRFIFLSSVSAGISVIFITYVVDWIKNINSNFKQATGGTDNNVFREGMISVGLQKYSESPVFGSFFKYGGAYEPPQVVYINSSTVANILPLHNDYLEIMVSGGIIGLVLFLICFFLPVVNYLNNRDYIFNEEKIAGDSLFISVIIGATTIAFNPVMNSSRSGFMLTVLSAVLLYISGISARRGRFVLSKS
ncbi:O-antigen ligase family protein [Deinococcus sedimenti]|uniref:O-antigen ligase family protein n=1 Tax=Deinococcus sedimenti TaxID=1867090 RepID=UPI001665A61A|nr:O-antigen ligase family protein [Deinococcus sedimenti]